MSARTLANLIGKTFGHWFVLAEATPIYISGRRRRRWACECDCGNVCEVQQSILLDGQSTRCMKCGKREPISGGKGYSVKFGREHRIWQNMLYRCYTQSHRQFHYYGGRGITVCDRWRFGEDGKHPFVCFVEDMGTRPNPRLSIDRINNDGNYEPGNCRWATWKQQANNTRRTRTTQYNKAS